MDVKGAKAGWKDGRTDGYPDICFLCTWIFFCNMFALGILVQVLSAGMRGMKGLRVLEEDLFEGCGERSKCIIQKSGGGWNHVE